MNIFVVFLILGVIFLVYKKISMKKPKNLKLDKFKNRLQSTQTNIDRIFLREEEKTFSNPNINIISEFTIMKKILIENPIYIELDFQNLRNPN